MRAKNALSREDRPGVLASDLAITCASAVLSSLDDYGAGPMTATFVASNAAGIMHRIRLRNAATSARGNALLQFFYPVQNDEEMRRGIWRLLAMTPRKFLPPWPTGSRWWHPIFPLGGRCEWIR